MEGSKIYGKNCWHKMESFPYLSVLIYVYYQVFSTFFICFKEYIMQIKFLDKDDLLLPINVALRN